MPRFTRPEKHRLRGMMIEKLKSARYRPSCLPHLASMARASSMLIAEVRG